MTPEYILKTAHGDLVAGQLLKLTHKTTLYEPSRITIEHPVTGILVHIPISKITPNPDCGRLSHHLRLGF